MRSYYCNSRSSMSLTLNPTAIIARAFIILLNVSLSPDKARAGTPRHAANVRRWPVRIGGLADRQTMTRSSWSLSRHFVAAFTPNTIWHLGKKYIANKIDVKCFTHKYRLILSPKNVIYSSSMAFHTNVGWKNECFLGGKILHIWWKIVLFVMKKVKGAFVGGPGLGGIYYIVLVVTLGSYFLKNTRGCYSKDWITTTL